MSFNRMISITDIEKTAQKRRTKWKWKWSSYGNFRQPAELKEEYPVSAQVVATKAERDDEIRAIFEGKEDKLILVIGPCSADNEDAVIDYISRLRKVQDKVADKIFMIPRIYTNKPRTIGIGYKGMLHQPDPEKRNGYVKRNHSDSPDA